MRSERAMLIFSFIYQDLKNAESVMQYRNVKELKKNVLFFNHDQPEGIDNRIKSYLNTYEANFVVNFYYYLLQQGYKESQI